MHAASNLGQNLKQLRGVRGFTQAQLASLSGVPRPTVATLESGSANPTLTVLMKIATALQVSVEELISPPRAAARHYPAADLPTTLKGRVSVRQLLPDTIPGVVVERMGFERGARMSGTPHRPGTREYLTCESGAVELIASGELYRLEPGDVVVFRGDQRHGYRNLAAGASVAYSVVLPGGH